MKKILKIIKKYFHLNYKEKANINSRLSLLGNAFVAFCKMVMGIFSTSIFLFISAFYSLGCMASKQTYFAGLNHSKIDKEQEPKYYLRIAIILLFTDIIYIVYMIRLFFIPSASRYPQVVGIGLAFISTLEMYFAIRGLIKSKKHDELLLSGLKCVSLSTALLSIVLAQTAILSFTMPEVDCSIYNALAGILFGFVCIIIAIAMLFKYNKVVKNKKLAKKQFQFKLLKKTDNISELLKYEEVLLNIEKLENSIFDMIKVNNKIIDDYIDLTSYGPDDIINRCELSKKMESNYILLDNVDKYCEQDSNNLDNLILIIKKIEEINIPIIIGNASVFFEKNIKNKKLLKKIYGIYQNNLLTNVLNEDKKSILLLNKIDANYKKIYTSEQITDKKQEEKIFDLALKYDCNVDIEVN